MLAKNYQHRILMGSQFRVNDLPCFFLHPSEEQCASKTLLSSEIMIANPKAIFFLGKYLENKVERIAQFKRKLIGVGGVKFVLFIV